MLISKTISAISINVPQLINNVNYDSINIQNMNVFEMKFLLKFKFLKPKAKSTK